MVAFCIAALSLLPLVISSPVPNPFKRSTCGPFPYSSPESWALCDAKGHVYDDCTIKTWTSANKNWEDCYDACLNDLRCISFTYNDKNSTCKTLDLPIKNKGWTPDSTSTERFWNLRGCFDISSCNSQQSCTTGGSGSSGSGSGSGSGGSSSGSSGSGSSGSGSSSSGSSGSGSSSSGSSSSGSSGSGSSGSGSSGSGSSSSGSSGSGSSGSGSSGSTGSGSSGSSGSSSSGSSGSGSSGSSSGGSGSGSSGSGSSGSGSSGSGTGSSSGSSSGGSASQTTLLPAVHWDYPVDDIRNLKPTDSAELYYSENGVSDPAVQHLFASLSSTLQHNTVVLEHSVFVQSVSCTADGILVTFVNSAAYQYAAANWNKPPFVLVTYTEGCKEATNERTFWQISAITPHADSNSITCTVEKEIAVEDFFDDVELIWGVYDPSQAGSGLPNGTSSGGSGTGSSGSGGSNNGGASNGGSACGAAPAATIDGFPAAACGAADFDAQLDKAIGFLDFSASDFGSDVGDFAPGITFSSDDLEYDDTNMRRRSLALQKRWSIGGFFKAAVSVVAQAVTTVATAPLQIARAAVQAIPVVGEAIAKATELDPSISGNSDINLGPTQDQDTPWGKGSLIYTKEASKGQGKADLNLYCVDCGIRGKVYLFGQAKWDVVNGLKALNANVNADITAGLHVGLVATAQYKDKKSKQLVRQGIPELGLAVKGIFSAGVYVGIDATIDVDIEAEGQAIAGVAMHWPNFVANLNLFDQNSAGTSSITGYQPDFERRFEASGSISATATLALPISFNVGVEIVPLSFKRAISLIEQPSITGKATAAGSIGGAAPASETCNNGIEYSLNIANDVLFDFLGIKTFTLNHIDQNVIPPTCKQLPGQSSSSTVTSTTETSTGTDQPTATTSTDGGDSTGTTTTDGGDTTPTTTTDGGDTTPTTTTDGGDSTPTTTDGGDTPTTTDGGDSTPTSTSDSSDPTTTDGSDGQPTTTDTTPTETAAPEKRAVLDKRFGINSSAISAASAVANSVAGVVASSTTPSAPAPTTTATETTATDAEETGTATTSASDTEGTDSSGDYDLDNDPNGPSFDSDAGSASGDDVDDDSSTDPSGLDGEESDADSQAGEAQNVEGFQYATITDSHGQFNLIPGDDGNLYAGPYGDGSDGSGLYGIYDNVAAFDDNERPIHYYPDVMDKFGVSRIRLSEEEEIPQTADMIVLKSINYDDDSNTPNPLFAVSTKGDAFALVLCNFKNKATSKVFIVNGQDGLNALEQNGDLTYIVTGAPVDSCTPLQLVFGPMSS